MIRIFKFVASLLCFLLTTSQISFAAISIDSFGAIPNDKRVSAAFQNAEALNLAFQAANQVASTDDLDARTVHIPPGKTYYIMPVHLMGLNHVTFQIDGTLIVSDNISEWPRNQYGGFVGEVLYFEDCKNFVMRGNGLIDGNGFKWWVSAILNRIPQRRPHLVTMRNMVDTLIEGIRVKNSPAFHFALRDMLNLVVRNIDIKVNITAQRTLFDKYGLWLKGVPTFPLNTDGIDPSGRNILIQNVTVENFDDAIVVKPTNGSSAKHGINCSEDILVENIRVKYGVGMSIGSVPPKNKANCVRNVTFRNIVFEKPLKAIYIKTNPGDQGSGIIENILYENITINKPIWWAIYIGPQQQLQPDGSGPGCMFYPFVRECPTQPRVTIRNVTLRNIEVRDGLLSPGILRCDERNPCTNFKFENVVAKGGLSGLPYICENIKGSYIGSSPKPKCFSQ